MPAPHTERHAPLLTPKTKERDTNSSSDTNAMPFLRWQGHLAPDRTRAGSPCHSAAYERLSQRGRGILPLIEHGLEARATWLPITVKSESGHSPHAPD